MASSAGAVYVDVKADTAPFEKSMGGLGKIASRFGGIVSKALAGAALAGFGRECTELASELTEVQNVVDQVFPHMSAQVDAWSAGLVESFGLSETKAKQYVGTLGSMARSLGFAEDQAYGMATSMAELAGDIASFYDMSSDQAYEKLQSVFTGMVQPLRSIGVNMTQASLDAFALANGFGRTTAEMGEAEKALLRYQYVLDRTSFAQGDFARTNQTWANQLRILSMRFDELKVAIGNSLIAVLTPVLQVVNSVIAALTTAANAVYRFIQAFASTGLGRLVKGASGAVGALAGRSSAAAESTSGLADAQEAAAGAAGAQNAAQAKLNRTLAGFDRINKLASQSAGGGGGGGGGIGGISDAFEALGDAKLEALDLQSVLDSIEIPEGLLQSFGHLKDAAAHLGSVTSGALSWAWENVLEPLGRWTIDELAPQAVDTLASGFDALASTLEFLAPYWQEFWDAELAPKFEALGNILIMSLKGWQLAFDWISETMDGLPARIDSLKRRAERFFSALKKAAEGAGKVLKGLATGDFGLVQEGIADIQGAWDGLRSKELSIDVKNRGAATLGGLKADYASLKSKVIGIDANDAASAKIGAAVSKLGTFSSKTATLSATDNASSKIDAAAAKLRNFNSKSVTLTINPTLSKSSIKVSLTGTTGKISLLAQGGYVERNTPRLAVIGDNRREGEIVAPESKLQAMADRASGGGMGAEALLPVLNAILAAVEESGAVYLDGHDISRRVVADVNAQTRATGRCAILV